MAGGELLDGLISYNNLTEAVVVYYLQQLLSAVNYLSQRNIAHLDIKVTTRAMISNTSLIYIPIHSPRTCSCLVMTLLF